MLRYVSYDIVFQEIPGEVSLAINISNCPNHCKGCHSLHLWNDYGEILDGNALSGLLEKYGNAITCVCFMGGDAFPNQVENLAVFIRKRSKENIKVGWYSGKPNFPSCCLLSNFDYLKLGPYIERLGGLDSPGTNQRFYQIVNGAMEDRTSLFLKKKSVAF